MSHVPDYSFLHSIPMNGACLLQHRLISFFCRFHRGLINIVMISGKHNWRFQRRIFKTCPVADGSPVVCRCFLLTFHHIAIEIPTGRTGKFLSFTRLTNFDEIAIIRRAGTRLIIVVCEITFVSRARTCLIFTAITGISLAPVVVHIVEEFHKHIAVHTGIRGTIQSGRTTIIVHHEVMMIGGGRTAPLCTITAGALSMTGIVESFVGNTPLHSGEMVIIHRDVLFGAPSETAVIHYYLLTILNT